MERKEELFRKWRGFVSWRGGTEKGKRAEGRLEETSCRLLIIVIINGRKQANREGCVPDNIGGGAC